MTDDTNPTTPITPVTDETAAAPRGRRSLRPIALGVIAGVATAALASGGIALASSLTLPDDDRLVISSTPLAATPSPSDDSTPSPSVSPSEDAAPSGATYDQVTAAALAAVGGGTVLEVDQGDSPGDAAWKVEIRLANGNEAEVRLAADLTVLRVDLDSSSGDHGGSDDSGSDDHGSDGHGSDD